MPTGVLLLPPGYHPLINGAVVPNGKLAFFRSGTTTPQDTYSDSTLSTPNANPIELNATGGLDTLVYGDPASGFDYRMRVLSSADAVLDTHDDLVAYGADTATYSEGSFTGSITGCDAAVTGTVTYRITANSAGTGKICTLYCAAAIQGTSNTTAMTMTGLPAACTPSGAVQVPLIVADNSTNVVGMASIAAAATTIVFACDATLSTTGFTNSNLKGLSAGCAFSYPL